MPSTAVNEIFSGPVEAVVSMTEKQSYKPSGQRNATTFVYFNCSLLSVIWRIKYYIRQYCRPSRLMLLCWGTECWHCDAPKAINSYWRHVSSHYIAWLSATDFTSTFEQSMEVYSNSSVAVTGRIGTASPGSEVSP